ncbi:MAG TPA: hypothetical protein VLY04_03455 [Bryobacteraceae bacterium]|nr:hypothetical protein [Bryobacteraceae bacterium]
MAVPNRLAREGEELVTYRFPTGSLGMASPADVKRVAAPRPGMRRTVWRTLKEWFDPPPATAVCAVCIPPGARLELRGIPARLQQQLGVSCEEEVVFTQISANVNSYRDALRFGGGHEVRLQDLREGMWVRVLDLTSAEEVQWRMEAEVR